MLFNKNQAIYLQIMNQIKLDIISGRLSPNDKLPAIREFALEIKVNPNTVQRSYQELERENIIITQRGIGSFVTPDISLIKNLKNENAKEQAKAFLNKMKLMGFSKDEIINILNNLEENNG
ncbi:MAG: GntR family transcriptional regulator [Peptoniphilaceae bacterium]